MVDVGWYRTTIRSFEREIYTIPNSVFSRNVVLNITRKQKEWRFFEFFGECTFVFRARRGAVMHSWPFTLFICTEEAAFAHHGKMELSYGWSPQAEWLQPKAPAWLLQDLQIGQSCCYLLMHVTGLKCPVCTGRIQDIQAVLPRTLAMAPAYATPS